MTNTNVYHKILFLFLCQNKILKINSSNTNLYFKIFYSLIQPFFMASFICSSIQGFNAGKTSIAKPERL